MRARNVALRLRRFTRQEFADEVGLSPSVASTYLTALGEAVSEIDRIPNPRGRGRPLKVYGFIPPRERSDYVPDRLPGRQPPVELEVVRKTRQAKRPVDGTGRRFRRRVQDKVQRGDLAYAEARGFRFKRKTTHGVLVEKNGAHELVPRGDNDPRASKNTRAKLRRTA